MRSWLSIYGICCVGLISFAFLALWAFSDFGNLDFSISGAITLILGSIVVAALAVALMAAIFWSNRSGADEEAFKMDIHRERDR